MGSIRAPYDVVVVGGGAGGIATSASLSRRRPELSMAIIEPRETHYYQPGWTLVGGGVFKRNQTARMMARVMPRCVSWIKAAVSEFAPERNEVVLEHGERVRLSRSGRGAGDRAQLGRRARPSRHPRLF